MAHKMLENARIPLIGLRADRPGDLRQAALEVLVKRPPPTEAWFSAEEEILDLLDRRSEGSNSDEVLQLAACVPLKSVRQRLRQIATDPTDPHAVEARESLARVGEQDAADMLIDDIASATMPEFVARNLALSPLGRMQISTDRLTKVTKALNPHDPDQSNAYVWGAISLAKSGKFELLDKVVDKLDEGWEPSMFWGNPFVVRHDLKLAAVDSELLQRYAEHKVGGLRPDEIELLKNDNELGTPKLNLINSLRLEPISESSAPTGERQAIDPDAVFRFDEFREVIQPNLERALDAEWFYDIAPNALRDVSAHLHLLGPQIQDGYLPTLIGNDLVDLLSRLPDFEPDGPGIIRAYVDLLRQTGKRSEDFEEQLGWMLAQGDLDRVLEDSEDLLLSDDEFEQAIAWSLTRNAANFGQGQSPPFFGAGENALDGIAAALGNAIDSPLLDSAPQSASPPVESQRNPLEASPDTGVGGDPPRSAYALLDCPDRVKPMTDFAVTVGLSENPSAGVTGGEFTRPEWSVGDYEITIKLILDGFLLAPGEANLITRTVTAGDPYPSVDVHFLAIDGAPFKPIRTIHAEYSIEGQLIGSASRPIVVCDDATDGEPVSPAIGRDMSMPPGVPKPDMTISITRGNTEARGQLVWGILTPHGAIDTTLPEQEDEHKSDIGEDTESWARELMNAVNKKASGEPLAPLMKGAGKKIRGKIPLWVRRKLRDLAALFPDTNGPRPTVFLVSDEPNIPWELAYLKLGDDRENFLGAEFVVGRWVRGDYDIDGVRVPAYPPPTKHTIRSMAVISGDYSGARNWNNLEGAQEEASELESTYHATPVNADGGLATWLIEQADVDAIHFAVHGNWSLGGNADGIVLDDGTTLSPTEVLAADLKRRPFVFLNACQLGQGEQTLGDYGGIASAFLQAGASGVIAALWNINDRQAKELATDFYESIGSAVDEPGELFRQQRAMFSDDTKSKLSLAYVFFGHPQLRMKLEIPQSNPSSEV